MKSLTVNLISSDRITHLAKSYWSPETIDSHKPYDLDVIENIYETEILMTLSHQLLGSPRIKVLELSQYLENYVWPNFNETATKAHLISVVVLINEKIKERVSPWASFEKYPKSFPFFFRHLTRGLIDEENTFSMREQIHMIMCLNHLYNSFESDIIRKEIANTVSYNILECISEGQFKKTLKLFPSWSKALKRTARHKSKLATEELDSFIFDTKFLYSLMKLYLRKLSIIKSERDVDIDLIQYCERFIELMIDLESQLTTRRYFNTLLHGCNLITKSERSALSKLSEGKLFSQLLYILRIYAHFQINENTGLPLTERESMEKHYAELDELELFVFKHFSDRHEIRFSSKAALGTKTNLLQYLKQFDQQELLKLCKLLHIIEEEEEESLNADFLLDILVYNFEKRQSQIETINKMPLYPTDDIIWDDNVVPSEYYSGDACLALPKLNLQFLTLHDYLLRNFDLFRLESTYEIRQDIEDVILRLNAWEAENKKVLFKGWARMAHPITTFAVCEVAKPDIGEDKPSTVRADVTVTLDVHPNIRNEWESLRKHDVCFLISIMKPKEEPNVNGFFPKEYGIHFIRGCEIEGMLDDNGRVIEEGPDPKPQLKGIARTFRVWLDPNQYKIDMDNTHHKKSTDVYETFNVIIRRKPKENNFKAVLETIRDLMNTKCVVPDWLLDIILGYGDPEAAHYSKMGNSLKLLDFNDTFLDMNHIKESFPGYNIIDVSENQHKPPFRLRFHDKCEDEKKTDKNIDVLPYVIPSRGPYPYTIPRQNTIRFTPTQIEAIKSGMQPGLTMVVGPPGTGKTDVAVQIISNIYHNNPRERTLIVTHSNQALNQLFEKIMALDVDERHLLRLGHGEEALETEKDYSRYGRVNYVLNKRLELLSEVTRLKNSLGVMGEMGASCETAGYFFLHHISSRWEKYIRQIKSSDDNELNVKDVNEYFPFHVFFANAPQPLFKEKSYEDDLETAVGCFIYLKNVFTQLEEFRAFEMLRGGLDRTKYLLVKEAKIIAMTCTHAALKRHELVKLGFQFDNILMEESAQILEIETFIPLLLQNPEDGRNRLKRWVMIGDHHQLPPVIKNMAFQKFSNMEQSLFTRFVRLGVPTIDLDAQGRARPTICSLYDWKYKKLGNLEHVISLPEFKVANTGLAFDFQLINVDELEGKGESEPRKYFYQNRGEAEYAVHLFMYMRLMGYPANSISILTTYNGQKELLKDVIEQRCANNPIFGRPHKISTVDKYQGQQNDYIILSLVRTKAVGHIRDVRRLIVAMSRARLGLYIFAKVSLFKNCYELQQTFSKLTKRPLKLHLLPGEMIPCQRKCNQPPHMKSVIIEDVKHMSSLVQDIYMKACAPQKKY